MAADPRTTNTSHPDAEYEAACAVWYGALEDYLRLARDGAPAARLRVAAQAVHAAALRKGRLVRPAEEPPG